jgi:hypothetical protein
MLLAFEAFIDTYSTQTGTECLRRGNGKFYLITSRKGTDMEQKYSSGPVLTSVLYGVRG